MLPEACVCCPKSLSWLCCEGQEELGAFSDQQGDRQNGQTNPGIAMSVLISVPMTLETSHSFLIKTAMWVKWIYFIRQINIVFPSLSSSLIKRMQPLASSFMILSTGLINIWCSIQMKSVGSLTLDSLEYGLTHSYFSILEWSYKIE